MRAALNIDQTIFNHLMGHMFRHREEKEQGAFLFAKLMQSQGASNFEVIDHLQLSESNFSEQEEDYLELSEETWPKVIKQAHDLQACLVEVHSHIGPWDAAFSISDRRGLRGTVPHVWWRLKNRPYIALVFTKNGFDALVWLDSPRDPVPLNYISVDGVIMKPTNHSIAYWR